MNDFPAPSEPTSGGGGKAIASLVLGCIGMLGWCIPLVGLPITIVGLILGILDLKSSKRGIAIAGVILNAIGLGLSIINAAIGAYLSVTGQMQF
ncbi:MAG: hypothetical protein AAGK09_04825 [Planctomycetota bacterium]